MDAKTTTVARPFLNGAIAPFSLRGRSILVAMDASAGAAAGARAALALAREFGALVHVVSAIDTRAFPFPPALDVALAVTYPDEDRTSHQRQINHMYELLSSATDEIVDWPVHVAVGTPTSAILEEAVNIEAALVILGLPKHGHIDRMLDNETTIDVMRHASCPVLAVVPGAIFPPVHALVATDFGAVSLGAIDALAAIAPASTMTLAYVSPPAALVGDECERMIHDLGVRAAFANVTRDFDHRKVTFDHVMLEHIAPKTTAETLLSFAEETKCDLIAVGSTRRRMLQRWLMGSVSTELVRDGARSVLVMPPVSPQSGRPDELL